MVRVPVDVHGLVVGLSVGMVLSVAEVRSCVEEVGDFEIRLDCNAQTERFKKFRNVFFSSLSFASRPLETASPLSLWRPTFSSPNT